MRCGWVAANPLLFMHLVAGIHNEALMLGLMLAGTEFALRGIDADSTRCCRDRWPGRAAASEWVALVRRWRCCWPAPC